MGQKRVVLLDFDGVLADSFENAYRTARCFFPTLTSNEYRSMFDENIYEAAKKREVIEPPKETRDYIDVYLEGFESVRLYPGAKECITRLSESHSLALVTSANHVFVQRLLAGAGLIEKFVEIMDAEVHTSKIEKIRLVLERQEVNSRDCVFITDTLGDMHEAKEHRIDVIACSWGYQDREHLQKGVPFRIVDSLEALPDAIDDFFSRAAA